MSQTLSLYRLQQIDIQVDRLQTRLQAIQQMLDDDTEMLQLNEQARAAEARVLAAEQALKQTEEDVQNQQIKIEQTQSSLYKGKSHSPKELQDLQNDVAALKRHLATLEDRQIEAMMASETAAAELQSAKTKLAVGRDGRAEKSKGLRQEQETLKNDLERLFVERNAVAGAVPPTELGLYDQLRKQHRGIAVAVIGDSSCGACGSTLSLAQIQSARSSGRMTSVHLAAVSFTEVKSCHRCGMRFRFPNFDNFSFWLGVVLSSLIWWVVSMLRPAFQQIRANAHLAQTSKKEKAHTVNAVEERYRQAVLRQAQGQHLAAPLFSLDEILEPSQLLAPPPRVEPGAPLYNEDIVDTTVPYLPAWPELAAIYKAPAISLSEALSGNSDIVLVGQTGMGKTVALASLTSQLARRDPEPGLAPEMLPFLVHVADLGLPTNKDNPLNALIDQVAEKASVFDLPRIPDFVRRAFSDGRALLLLDGTDELTPDSLKDVVEFIRAIKRAYPKARVITTASSEYLDGLVSLNFIPFALTAWTSDQRSKFLEKWGELWARHVATESWAQAGDQVNPLLLNSWLSADSRNLTPLELTLKAWGAYAGDIRGSRPADALETHIRRITPADTPREALETLALQANLATAPIFAPREARQWIKSFEPNEPESIENANQGKKKKKQSGKSGDQKSPSLGLISKMVESGLLSQHRNDQMRFAHPLFGGYLAGKPLASYTDAILQQPPWIGKYLAMHYLAVHGDATPLSNALLAQVDRPLARNLLVPARWLRDTPVQAPWHGQVMAKLAELLQQTGQPLGLRGQALAALAQCGEAGSAILFRQLLMGHEAELLQLAALGSGALRDVKSVELLAALLNNPNPNVRRAACLALSAIGTTTAMDALASALLHGDETLRRAAAEAMANHASEGHKMLREGAGMKEDLNVRRAVVYGLGRVHESWAEDLLNKLQTEDSQWVVRNSAQEVLEDHRKPNPHIPKRLPPPSESPWLIAFAGKKGEGISPDKPPTNLLLLALKSDAPEERLASLEYLRMVPTEGVFDALYQAMYSGEPELREAVFRAFSEMACRGVDVPDPVQFGVGD